MLVVDDYTRRKWAYFLKSKDGIGDLFTTLLHWFKACGTSMPTMIILCDNAWENVSVLRAAANKFNVTDLELMPRNSPQYNGIVE